jgi:hypothetical protein
MTPPRRVVVLLALLLGAGVGPAAAAEHVGQVTVGGVAVPGATVTAAQGAQRVVTSTDDGGRYRFPDLADGVWTITVEMRGFAPTSRDVTIPAPAQPEAWQLTLLPFDEIARGLPLLAPAPGGAPAAVRRSTESSPATSTPPVFQRADIVAGGSASQASPPPASPSDGPPLDPTGMGAANGLLINGSVNNGAASPFAQLAAFGNNRRGQRWLYTGGMGVLLGNSAWDARPYSFTGASTPKPDYNDVQFLGTFGGPLRIPGLFDNGGQFTLGYQRLVDNNAFTSPARMPTALERAGDFSQTLDALGRPVRIIDPLTGQPFAGNRIPSERMSPQAAALAAYYPSPNIGGGNYNFQAPIVTTTRQDNVQSRFQRQITTRDGFAGSVNYNRTTTEGESLLGFDNLREGSGINAEGTFSHRFSQFLTLRGRYQYTRQTNETLPHFANRVNVSGDAGITGNDQAPVNWGPPRLVFASGIEPLSDALYAYLRSETHGWSAETFLSRGRHALTFGGGVRRHAIDILSQQDARGTFTFTGAASGFDFADFLLGTPQTSTIAFGNPDKFFRGNSWDAYFTDDWRVSASLTVNAGIRWEYEAPLTERLGRLVNLDVASGFSAIDPVIASDPNGPLTGIEYPESLLYPDKRGFQPRVGVAWRPVPGSSLVVRAGYGIYRNTNVYQSIATSLAQQPPLSTAFSIQNSADRPLTLASGFVAPSGVTANTFAVDPGFRVGYAHNWQASVQRDLPASLTVLATYLGTRGSHLMQEFLPNTYPAGASSPCPSCPAGFVYLTSGGSSTRHAGQLQLRRRLRNGLTGTVQYTLARAEDDAAAFLGASLNGAAIAQDWLDLDAEWAPSNFDQRHQVTAQVQYTTGMSVTGGALMGGIAGSLFRGWTITGQLTTGSGLPLTPLYLSPVSGTGVTGTIRAGLTGAPVEDVPEGLYANPAAYGPPAPGTWGNAGRNSITGPSQFNLNAGIRRTFPWGDRMNLEWGIDAINVLNRVTYNGVNMLVGSPQFGLPAGTHSMRKIQSVLRLRF